MVRGRSVRVSPVTSRTRGLRMSRTWRLGAAVAMIVLLASCSGDDSGAKATSTTRARDKVTTTTFVTVANQAKEVTDAVAAANGDLCKTFNVLNVMSGFNDPRNPADVKAAIDAAGAFYTALAEASAAEFPKESKVILDGYTSYAKGVADAGYTVAAARDTPIGGEAFQAAFTTIQKKCLKAQ